MKLSKPPPTCRMCGHLTGRNGVHCHSVMLNGCDNHFCFLCWPVHARTHDEEWQRMTQDEKDKLYQERT